MKRKLLNFIYKNDGATIIEFAVVAPLFFLLVFALVEFGMILYSKVIIEGIALEVTRTASLGKPNDAQCSNSKSREDYIKCFVKYKSAVLINGDKTQVQILRIGDGGTSVPDICFDTNPPSSDQDKCDVYQEVNGKAGYQGIQASNLGVGGQVIEVRISYPWSILMPLVGEFFKTTDNKGNSRNSFMVTASTVIRNEPFPTASATP